MNVKALCFIGVLCVFLPAKAIATDNPSQLDMNQSANINNSNWSTITHTYNVDNSPNMDYYIGIHSQLLKMPQISQLNFEQCLISCLNIVKTIFSITTDEINPRQETYRLADRLSIHLHVIH